MTLTILEKGQSTGVRIKVHSCVMRAMSKVIDELCSQSPGWNRAPRIEVGAGLLESTVQLVQFLYRQKIECLTSIRNTLYIAHQLQMDSVKQLIVDQCLKQKLYTQGELYQMMMEEPQEDNVSTDSEVTEPEIRKRKRNEITEPQVPLQLGQEDAVETYKRKRSAAAKKAWATRRRNAANRKKMNHRKKMNRRKEKPRNFRSGPITRSLRTRHI
jgi:hypothetical protein